MSSKDKGKRRNALGRGLSALLSDDEPEIKNNPANGDNVAEIEIANIETNPYQPRTHFDLEALDELSDSIKVQGIIQPITVRSMGAGKYQLISGERRLQASKLAGLTKVPAYIRTANDEQMLEMALIENIQRQDLNPIEIALAYQRLVEELNLKLENLGEKVGKKRATVNNYLRLLKLPPALQIGLKEGKISMGHARALIPVQDADAQLAIYQQAVEQQLSVRKVEELVRSLDSGATSKAKKSNETTGKSVHILKLEQNLEEKFGNRVLIKQGGNGKGEMKITFDSTEDLNRILEILDL
ncbi:MAG: ParB/RepB/Spo0J family partition protein [Bacteroidota bacterium]